MEHDISKFDRLLQSSVEPLVVGGQAVNLWANTFIADSPALHQFEPFLSKDCDLLGDATTLEKLAQETGWRCVYSPKAQPSPVVGYLQQVDENGEELVADVLYSIRGLDENDLRKVVQLSWREKRYRTLSPITLLKAKLANACELSQASPDGPRNDLKHIRILIECVRSYLKMALNEVQQGGVTERSLVNLFEEVFDMITSDNGLKVAKENQIDFLLCFPQESIPAGLPKLQNFCSFRLARVKKRTSRSRYS